MNNIDDIKNLDDLRRAKNELKMKMKGSTTRTKSSFLGSVVSGIFQKNDSIQSNALIPSTGNRTIEDNVASTLNFFSTRANNRFRLGDTAQTILSLAVVIATPIIAEKIKDYINRKI